MSPNAASTRTQQARIAQIVTRANWRVSLLNYRNHTAPLSGQQLRYRPDMIGEVRFHRWGDALAGMYAAEVVIGEVQRKITDFGATQL